MPKILIIEDCLVNYGDDRGGVCESVGALPDVSKDTARALVNMGRALYAKKDDDYDKGGRNTATAEMLKAAGKAAKAEADPARSEDKAA